MRPRSVPSGGARRAPGAPVGAGGGFLALLGGLALAGGLHAQDLEAGRQVAGQCRTCHGLDGHSRLLDAPHIGGEPAAYLAGQLRAFRSGERQHQMMSVVAAGLTDAQIEDVAAWYAAHAATATLGADPSAAPSACVECHGADGIARVEDAPNLAGEEPLYLVQQLEAFASGRRVHEVMTGIAQAMTEQEMRAAADWYGAITLEIGEAR